MRIRIAHHKGSGHRVRAVRVVPNHVARTRWTHSRPPLVHHGRRQHQPRHGRARSGPTTRRGCRKPRRPRSTGHDLLIRQQVQHVPGEDGVAEAPILRRCDASAVFPRSRAVPAAPGRGSRSNSAARMPGPNSRSYALGTWKGVFYFNSHGGDGSELDIYLLRRVRQPVQALGFLDAADQLTEGLDAAVEGRSKCAWSAADLDSNAPHRTMLCRPRRAPADPELPGHVGA